MAKKSEGGRIVKKQIVKLGGRVMCETTVPYPAEIIKGMKKAGYRVTEREGERKQDARAGA